MRFRFDVKEHARLIPGFTLFKYTKMKAKDFVLSKYPKAFCYGMIDNARRQTSTVIVKGIGGFEIFPNEGATTASKAWTNAKNNILAVADKQH